MKRVAYTAEWIRMTAKLVFGALLFLVMVSYLALPCFTNDAGGQFRSASGAQSCTEHKIFKPQADLCRLFQAPCESPMRFLIVVAIFAVSAFAARILPAENSRFRRRWKIRLGSLPFATADPPRLPAFAALRDA